ncbi:MAG: N-acetyltransferase [Actinobacteria bacterium]|nr:MAG: N-acetyltransferase [Actinomycetota bacterium]
MADERAVTIEQFGLGDRRIREFALLPWRLYRDDSLWTPPLNMDLVGNRLLGTKGLLTAEHPYHRQATVTHFLARRDGRAVGRVSAAVDERFNDFYEDRFGFFGFFEVEEDYDAAAALLDAARDWLATQGARIMRGPGDYTNATHMRQAVLVDGFDTPPTVELTHNPPFYGEFLERWGLAKVKDYHAYLIDLAKMPERLGHVADGVRKRYPNITTRQVDMKRFTEEVRLIISIYNEAWRENWGYLPITEGEADALAESLRPIVDPGLVRFAFVDGEDAAVLGAFPDPNWALLPKRKWYGDGDPVRLMRLLRVRRHIPRTRLMFFGIRPAFRRMGIDALLFDETLTHANERGYTTTEASMLLEDNEMILRASASMGGERYKTWRIYERPLGDAAPVAGEITEPLPPAAGEE